MHTQTKKVIPFRITFSIMNTQT